MKNLFKDQIANNKIATQQIIDQNTIKHYHSGREIKIGDQVLFASLQGDELNQDPKIIAICEQDFDLYEQDERCKDSNPPSIKPK
jgi:co-chaperonin GroES (HSP10)